MRSRVPSPLRSPTSICEIFGGVSAVDSSTADLPSLLIEIACSFALDSGKTMRGRPVCAGGTTRSVNRPLNISTVTAVGCSVTVVE